MEKKKWEKSPQELVDLFYAVMEAFPKAELRKMFGYPCAFYQGNMFVGLHEKSLAVRLARQDLEKAFLNRLGRPFSPIEGRIMREYVSLEEKVLKDPEEVKSFIGKAFSYVKTLPKKEKKT